MSKTINVAVYGSLKRGFYNHHYLVNEKFVGTGCVNGFEMFNMGSFPMITPGEGTVAVEVFQVTPGAFARLDRLECYPSFYKRQRVTVATADGTEQVCWIYYGDRDQVQGCAAVKNGNWVEDF